MRLRSFSAGAGFALFALAGGGPSAIAQGDKRPDPADPHVSSPAVKYESSFSDYQPFREQKLRSWKDANQEVAENPGMGSMNHGPGKGMPGMHSSPGAAATGRQGAAGHDMAAMPGTASKAGTAPQGQQGSMGHDMASMPGNPPKAGATQQGKKGAGHDMASMGGTPGMASKGTAAPKGAADHDAHSTKDAHGANKAAAGAPAGKDSHAAMSMDGGHSASGQPAKGGPGRLAGTGVVRGVDKANGRVKLTHDPLAAVGWPRMTLFFRLKDKSLADRVKDGDKVEFSLEKSSGGYVISALQQRPTTAEGKHVK
jgi:Cu/Ag efflux protein CusF